MDKFINLLYPHTIFFTSVNINKIKDVTFILDEYTVKIKVHKYYLDTF